MDIVHAKNTCAKTLHDKIMALLTKHKLDPRKIRGQAYDGASNMRGEFNGL